MTDANGAVGGKRRRGRPLGSTSEKRRKLMQKSDTSDSDFPATETAPTHCVPSQKNLKLVQKYQEALKVYEKTVFNSHMHHILRRIAAGPILQQRSQQEPVLQQLMDVAKKAMLSEVELVVWALHLERTNVNEVPLPLHVSLLVSAFAVKVALDAEVVPLRAFLERQQATFAENLEVWEKTYSKETLKLTLQELNAKWKELNRPLSNDDTRVINYNYYVDDVLQAGVTPVDSFTTCDPRPWWGAANDPAEPQQVRPIKPVPTAPQVFEPILAKECEEFSYAPIQWFEPVPMSPGLLFFNFPSPPVSALLQPMDENYDSRALPHIGQ